jgi:hypothetical protein
MTGGKKAEFITHFKTNFLYEIPRWSVVIIYNRNLHFPSAFSGFDGNLIKSSSER